MKRRTKTIWISMFIIFAVLGILTMVLFYMVDRDSTKQFNIAYNLQDTTLNEGIDMEIVIDDASHWVVDEGMETESVGTQYEGIVSNRFASDITDWKLVIPMPSGCLIDSFWNGSYTIEGSNLVITPHDINNTIPAGESIAFGFIMDSKELVKFESVKFVGYHHTIVRQYNLFWILIVGAVVWLIVLVAFISVDIRTRRFDEIRKSDAKIISESMKLFAGLIDAKDSYTRGHSIRVAHYSRELARRMKLSEDEAEKLGYIALMHDCGKIGVPDEVLTKPKGLEPDEIMVIKEHTITGGKILENFTAIKGIRDGALYHHERYDGKGYPEGLKGKEIPLCARIICVADTYDAMSTNRCYRGHLTQEQIVQELEAGRGTQFDPDIVTHMINMIDEGCCQLAENYTF